MSIHAEQNKTGRRIHAPKDFEKVRYEIAGMLLFHMPWYRIFFIAPAFL